MPREIAGRLKVPPRGILFTFLGSTHSSSDPGYNNEWYPGPLLGPNHEALPIDVQAQVILEI